MSRIFLEAEWKNLLMANYRIDPKVLQPFVPHRTELDTYNGVHYVSLVGFLFANVRVKGIGIPMHRQFEEVNLRFYVRYKEKGNWTRGVVFIKEIVPRPMVSMVANIFYGEKYATHRMRHGWQKEEGFLKVRYEWLVGQEWNYLQAICDPVAESVAEDSEAAFITEHYWGYTQINAARTGAYQVSHPRWKLHTVRDFSAHCQTDRLYGPQFREALEAPPSSVFVADGSPVQVMNGAKIVLPPEHE